MSTQGLMAPAGGGEREMAEGGGQRQDHIHSGALLTLQESKTLIFHG